MSNKEKPLSTERIRALLRNRPTAETFGIDADELRWILARLEELEELRGLEVSGNTGAAW